MTTAVEGVRERPWTKEEYYRLGELGFFLEQRVELIGGRIFVLGRQSPACATATSLANRLLNDLFRPHAHARCKGPLDLGPESEPEPDIAVVLKGPRDYMTGHPTQAVLVVEISDASLSYERSRKASLYASAGIADYWLINLVTPQVEIYRDPVADSAQPFGFRYATRTDHLPGDAVAPLALPTASIPVVDLLP